MIALFLPIRQEVLGGYTILEKGLNWFGAAVLTHKQMGGYYANIFLRIKAGVISSGKVCVSVSKVELL